MTCRMPTVLTVARRIVALGIAWTVPSCDPSPADDGDGLLADVEISLLEAMEIAAEELPDGVTLDAELSDEGEQGPQYDVDRYLDGDGVTHELVIDATTGEVLKRLIDPEDQEEGPELVAAIEGSSQGITLPRAVEIAASAADGTPVSVELALDDGEQDTIYVVLLHDEQRVLVVVGLDQGNVIAIEQAPPED